MNIIQETNIVYLPQNPQTPCMVHRCGSRYFLQNHQDLDTPLREIEAEEAWEYLNISESMRVIMRTTLNR